MNATDFRLVAIVGIVGVAAYLASKIPKLGTEAKNAIDNAVSDAVGYPETLGGAVYDKTHSPTFKATDFTTRPKNVAATYVGGGGTVPPTMSQKVMQAAPVISQNAYVLSSDESISAQNQFLGQ